MNLFDYGVVVVHPTPKMSKTPPSHYIGYYEGMKDLLKTALQEKHNFSMSDAVKKVGKAIPNHPKLNNKTKTLWAWRLVSMPEEDLRKRLASLEASLKVESEE